MSVYLSLVLLIFSGLPVIPTITAIFSICSLFQSHTHLSYSRFFWL